MPLGSREAEILRRDGKQEHKLLTPEQRLKLIDVCPYLVRSLPLVLKQPGMLTVSY